MEIISISKEALNLIIKRIALLSKQANELNVKFSNRKMEGLLNSQDVCDILQIKPRTLQTYRDTGKIGFTQIDRKIHYRGYDIRKFMEDNKSHCYGKIRYK